MPLLLNIFEYQTLVKDWFIPIINTNNTNAKDDLKSELNNLEKKQDRIKKKIEQNPIVECNKIQKKFFPELFHKFSKVKDPRHQSYIAYSTRTMLGTLYYKCIGGLSSMQEMTRKFNNEAVVKNIYSFLGESKKEYLPHGVTENEFLSRLNPEELEEIQKDIAYSMIRRKTFDGARVLKRWQIIIDATELDEGNQRKNEYYDVSAKSTFLKSPFAII